MHLTTVGAFAAAAAAASALAAPSSSSHNDDAHPVAKRTGSSYSIPIYKYDAHYAKTKRTTRTPEEVVDFARRQRAYVMGKYVDAFNVSKDAHLERREKAKRQTVGLTDVGPDSYYFAQVSVGTPAQVSSHLSLSYVGHSLMLSFFDQPLAIVLDTGSADFWVSATECTTANCVGLAKFNEGASSTFQNSSQGFTIQYGQGAVQGHMAGDTVSLAGYTVYSQSFAVASNIADGTLDAPASGLMGMGFQELSSSGTTPFWEVLVKENKLQDNAFTFQLARNPNVQTATQQSPGGVFTLGLIDSDQYSGSINYIDIPSSIQSFGYWAIPLQSLQLNGGNSVSINAVAAIDTGTTLIAVPLDIASEIYSSIQGAQPFSQLGQGYYVYPCSSTINLSFTFGGQAYAVNAQDFNSGNVDTQGRYCLGSVFGIDTGGAAPPYIIGDAFLKNWFSVYRYDPPSVGFAQLKGSGAQTVSTSGGIATPSVTVTQSASAGNTIPAQLTRSPVMQATGTSIYAASGISQPSAAGECGDAHLKRIQWKKFRN
jgi:cathepsin D